MSHVTDSQGNPVPTKFGIILHTVQVLSRFGFFPPRPAGETERERVTEREIWGGYD